MAGDVLLDLLRRVRAELPGVAPDRWAAIEQSLRAEYGGGEHYIARRSKGTLLGQIEQAAAAQAEISTGELARQLGVSVRHARRLRRLAGGG